VIAFFGDTMLMFYCKLQFLDAERCDSISFALPLLIKHHTFFISMPENTVN